MNEIANFAPGPSYVDPSVLKAFFNQAYGTGGFKNTGIPLGSTSHRSKIFLDEVLKPLNKITRELLDIPENYSIVWTRDGATENFARIARNFKDITYVNTGDFSNRAMDAYKKINSNITFISTQDDIEQNYIPLTSYNEGGLLHITCNNTVEGIEFHENHLNFYSKKTLLIDATSNIFSRKIHWKKHNVGMVYASTTKQLGVSGSCLIIIRNDLLDNIPNNLATSESYKVLVDKDSGLYTSNVDALFKALKTLEFYKSFGGIKVYEKLNFLKSKVLYDVIDASGGFYLGHALDCCRSKMNVVFFLNDDSLFDEFLEEAEKQGLYYLKGHKNLTNSLRASIYNMMPIEHVERLATFMENFQNKNS